MESITNKNSNLFYPKVLTIGPDYMKLKGGISSLLDVYAKNDPLFKFLPTYSSENNAINIVLFPIRCLFIIIFLIIHNDYGIVHIHGASKISFYRKYVLFVLIKYLLKRKVIYHIHGGGFHLFESESNLFGKKLIHHMVNQSDAIICLSDSWKDYFATTFKPQKIIILNNIIENPVLKDALNNKNIVQFVFLGKICEKKGIFDLLKVLDAKKTNLIGKIKVVIGGDGETGRLEEEISRLKLNDIVEYLGWVSGEKKQNLLDQSDIFILPSYYEGLPISILEAMSYKMPIITTNVGGIPSIVNQGINGFLIEPGDLNSLYSNILYFIDNPTKIIEFGENAYQTSLEFVPEKVILRLHSIYRSI